MGLATFFFWSLIGLAAYNAAWTVFMVVTLRRKPPKLGDSKNLPKAAVFLCLRGADPTLATSLRRLLSQDYPNYELFIAVDSKSDPAWNIVQQTIADMGADNVHVSPLRKRMKTCSLKCSSLVQLLDEIDDSYEVVVLADADLESHPTWLHELLAPLDNPKVGATFGNRWFLPTQGWIGSMVRQLCNGPSIIVMLAAQIPWGGSLAIRSSLIKTGNLRDKWAHAIVDDGPVRQVAKQQNLQLRFVPSLLMANREECDIGFAYNFLRRQFTWTSTYVRSWWPLIIAYTLASVGLWLGAIVSSVSFAVQGAVTEATLCIVGATTLSTVVMVLWVILDASARSVVRRQGEEVDTASPTHLLKIPLALGVAVVVHFWATLRATFGRRIVWRGVTYEIVGPWNIRILDESIPSPTPSAQGASI